jgi:hypothetical protein
MGLLQQPHLIHILLDTDKLQSLISETIKVLLEYC